MNIAEIRQKYPQYNDLSDEQLAQGLHKKFYSDMDFGEFSQKIGLARPQEKGYALGRVATLDKGATYGLGRKLGGLVNAIGAAPVDAIMGGQSLKDAFWNRYHEVADDAQQAQEQYAKDKPVEAMGLEIGSALVNPANKLGLGFIAKGANIGSKALRSAAVGSAVGGVAGGLDTENMTEVPEKALSGAQLGSIVGGALPAVGAIAKGGLKGLKQILGKTTGAGDRAIGDAFEAGVKGDKEFLAKMRAPIDADGLEKKVEANFKKIVEARNKTYEDDIVRLKNATADKNLDVNPVVNDVKNIIKNEGGGAQYLVDDDTSRVLDKTKSVLNQFYKDKGRHNLEGFDNLKKALQNIKTQEGSNAERVKTQITNSVRNQILKQSPQYKAINDAYAKDSALINDLKKVFSLNRNANSETILKKIQSTARNNANTDWSYRAQLLKKLDPNGEIQKEISANALSSAAPRGGIAGLFGGAGLLSALYNPARAPLLAASSPMAMGYAAYGLGRASKLTPKNIEKLSPYVAQMLVQNQ